MANTGKILVTGATGNVGNVIIPNLTNLGADVRALVRDESKAQGLKNASIEVVVGDMDKPHTLDAAFRGVDNVLLITPPNPNQVIQAKNVIHAAKRNGNQLIVRLSAGAVKEMPGALPRVSGQHAEIDDELRASGVPHAILKPHFFMQNTMMAADTVVSGCPTCEHGIVYMAMKDGKIGMLDVRDVADVAVKVLTEDGHEGKEYTLTGPASISVHDVAAALSKVLGKQVIYVDVPTEAARQAMISMEVPEWMADALGEYTTAFSEGYGDFTTDAVENITAQPARSYETFARDFAQVFGGAAPQAA